MQNILESYLVDLGFKPDRQSFSHFTGILADAEKSVSGHTGGMLRRVLEAQSGIVGAFTSISAAILGVMDRASMADQGYRLLGLRMLMTTEQARKMSMVTGALGASLEEVVWDPELHARALVLSQDIDRMTEKLGPGFEGSMKSIRDFRAEFGRLQIGLEFLGMRFTEDLWARLMPGAAGKDFHDWITWAEDNIPEFSQKLVDSAVPALENTWRILKSLYEVGEQATIAFTNLVGTLSGDSSIEGTTLSFDHLSRAIEHVGDWMTQFFLWFAHAERSLGDFASAAALATSGRFGEAAEQFRKGYADFSKTPPIDLTKTPEQYRAELAKADAAQQNTTVPQKPGTNTPGWAANAEQLSNDIRSILPSTPKAGAAEGAILGRILGFPGSIAGAEIGGALGWMSQFVPDAASGRKYGEKEFEAWRRRYAKEGGSNALLDTLETLGRVMEFWKWKPGDAGTPATFAAPSTNPGTSQPLPPVEAAGSSLIDRLAGAITKYEAGSDPNSIAHRLNNPGNLREWGDLPREGGYTKFPTWESGMAALKEQIAKNIGRGLTLEEFFAGSDAYSGYAPKGDKNDPDAYARAVAKQLGIPLDVPLNQIPAPSAPASPSAVSPISYMMPSWEGASADHRAMLASYAGTPFGITGNIPSDRGTAYIPDSDHTPELMAAFANMNRMPMSSRGTGDVSPTINMGDITVSVTLSGSNLDENRVGRIVAEKVREAMDEQVVFDLAQMNALY